MSMVGRVRFATALMLGAALVLAGCSGSGDAKSKEGEAKDGKAGKAETRAGQAVSVSPIEPMNFSPRLIVAGQVQAVQSARVFPTASGAQVVRLLVDAGDRVNAGQVLAVLDATQISADRDLLEAQVRRARTALAEARVQVTAAEQDLNRVSSGIRETQLNLRQAEVAYQQARSEYERARSTTEEGALSEEAVEARRAAMELAQARLDGQRGDVRAITDNRRQGLAQARARASAAEADLAVAIAQQRQSNVRQNAGNVVAPVSGIVTERNVSVGEIAGAAGTPMFVITAGGALEVAAEVPEADMPRLVPGMSASFRAPDGSTVLATLRRMPAQIDPQRRTGLARFSLQPTPQVQAGMFLTGEASSQPRGVMAVPASALVYDSEGTSVYVVGANNRVNRVRVQVGQREGAFAELVDGPPAGTLVVTAGASFLSQNELINPKREEPASSGTAPATPATTPAAPAPAAPGKQ
ncbi:MAG: efflux RND transporter periplasmic adaptor subunit [Hyphomonadaceae bacterium]|jgi:HlyD family secretion protein|nr:efflux RND transporter periplasmic adaptor subunit [Hyphomonadaceae bacterium]